MTKKFKSLSINVDSGENGQVEFFEVTGNTTQRTLQCVHCGQHWVPQPGSGTLRGRCTKCQGPLCGDELCLKECVPYEAQVEILEGNKKTTSKYKGTETERRLVAFINQGKHQILIAEEEAYRRRK